MQLERRTYRRHPVDACRAMVFSHGSFTMGNVININMCGLQIEYRTVEVEPGKWNKIDMFMQGTRHCVLGVSCEPKYDIAANGSTDVPNGSFHTRVAGLNFVRLSAHQKNQLTRFLEQCAVQLQIYHTRD